MNIIINYRGKTPTIAFNSLISVENYFFYIDF